MKTNLTIIFKASSSVARVARTEVKKQRVFDRESNNSTKKEAPVELDPDMVSFYSPVVPAKLPEIPSISILNEKAMEIRVEISENGTYVTWKGILYLLLKFYKCQHIGQFGLTHATHLETINELVRYQRKIDSFIIEYNLTISYATYYELEQSLCKYFNISSYSELNVGPLCENKLTRELFRLPDYVKTEDLNRNSITYLDLFRYLRKYLDEKQLWSIKNIQINEFESYLMEKIDLEYLPVRINSLAIMIGVMKNVKRLYNDSYKKCEISFSNELKSLFENQREMIKNELIRKLNDLEKKREVESQLYLISIEPDYLLNELLVMFELILNENDSEYLSDFLKTIKSHEYLKYILSLALYMCKQRDLKYYLEKLETNSSNTNSYTNILKRVFLKLADYLTKKQLKFFLNKFLFERKIEIVDFDSIKRKHTRFDEMIEESMNDEDDCTIIKEIRRKSNNNETNLMSDFIVLSKIKELINMKSAELSLIDLLVYLEDNYYNLLNTDMKQSHSFVSYLSQNKTEFDPLLALKKDKNDVDRDKCYLSRGLSDYLKQIMKNFNIKHLTEDFKLKAQSAICSYYDAVSLEEINKSFKSADVLFNSLPREDDENRMDSINDNLIQCVYEDAVVGLDGQSTSTCDDEFMHINKLLASCPLLENLYDYTEWNLMYSPKHGSLKEFLCKRRELGIVGYEVRPGCLLKLSSVTDMNKLKESISNCNSTNSAGHLVSLIAVKYETLKKSPIQLISNEIYSSLLSIYNSNSEKFYLFLVKFIRRVPLKLLSKCLFKFFIEPLAKIEGSVQLVKENLFKQACLIEEYNFFYNLSILCCIPEWSRNKFELFKNKITSTTSVAEEIKPQMLNPRAVDSQVTDEVIESFASSTLNVHSASQQEEIEKIRLLKYGIGLELNEQNERIMKSLKNEISSCLQTLSNELYNKEMHFVLELIQNCDDNKYSSSIHPTVIFMIDSESITVFNNEIGFSKQNIEAISSIGQSTKGKTEYGYIGRKGIGFKSVFTVTNCPEIHSNGYHIKFDANIKQFGHFSYILPIWCEDRNNLLRNERTLREFCGIEDGLNTCIYLPFKSETERQRHKSRSLTHSFNDIQSSLLLFLNRLKNITLINKVQLTKRFYRRVDKNEHIIEIIENNFKVKENFVEIECGHASQEWLIQRRKLSIPNFIDKPNANIQSTEVCLAFPLYNITDKPSALPKLNVYAYLPVRCYNFSFILQADFSLTSSRQDILNDSDWNQWLINEIPQLFIDSFEPFLEYYSLKSVDKLHIIIAFLKFIPFDYEITDEFFQHIPKQVVQLVQNLKFLPVLGNNREGEFVLKKPIECIFIKDKQIHELLSHELLNSYLGCSYLNPKLYELEDGSIDDNMLKVLFRLGVRQLQVDDILNILKIIFSNDEEVNFKHAYEWLVIMNNYLQTNELNNRIVMNEIKMLKFLPLVGHSKLKSLTQEKAIYFPYKFNDDSEMLNENIEYLTNLIERELNIIDINRLMCLENEVLNNCLINFFKKLGIKTLNSCEIIENYVMPTFELATIASIQKDIDFETKFILNLLYLQSYWLHNVDSLQKHYDRLKANIVILVNDSTKNSRKFVTIQSGLVYLSSLYDSNGFEDIDNELVKDLDFYFVDSIYLNETIKLNKISKKSSLSTDILIENWRRFFNYFNIFDAFTPRVCNEKSVDYTCLPFENFVEKVQEFGRFESTDCEKMKFANIFVKFFKIFNQKWTNLFQSYKNIRNSENISHDSDIKTTFYKFLKTKAWVLAEFKVYYTDSNEVKFRKYHQFLKPSEVFVKNESNLSFYGDHKIPYLYESAADNLNKEYLKDLNFKEAFDVNEFFDFFKDNLIQSEFVQMNQIKKIYSLMSNNMFNSTINEILHCKFIFVPKKQSTEIACGQFYSKEEVYWNDPTGTFVKYTNVCNKFELESHYLDLKQVFIGQFNCSVLPSLNDYVSVIDFFIRNLITEKASLTSQLLNSIFEIYEIIFENYCCVDGSIDSVKRNSFLNTIQNKSLFICYNNKFVCQSEAVILNDNFMISKHFKDSLNFLLIPSKDKGEAYSNFSESQFKVNKLSKNLEKFFMQVCNFRVLSSVVETKIDLERDNLNIESITTPTCINQLLPYIQAYLYSKKQEYEEFYSIFQSNEINLKMFQLNAIFLNHYYTPNTDINSLNNNESKVFVRVVNEIKENSYEYFVRKDHLENEKELIKGFLKIFFVKSFNKSLEKDLLNFAMCVNNSYSKTPLSSSDKSEIESDYEIKLTLPASESSWLIKDDLDRKISAKTKKSFQKCQQPQQTVDPLFSIYTQVAREQQNLPNELSQLPLANNRNYVTTNRAIQNNNHLIAENSLNNFMHKGNLNSKLFLTQNYAKSEIVIDDLTSELRMTNKSNEVKIEFNNKIVNENLEDFKSKIGRWGEEFIYKTLVNKYEKEIKRSLVKIEWINENCESGHPYDLKFIRYDEEDWCVPKEEIFIEVKSTSKGDNELNDYFPVSIKEILFAINNSSNYHIYRLHNAFNQNLELIKIKRITNIHSNLVKHNLNLVMIV